MRSIAWRKSLLFSWISYCAQMRLLIQWKKTTGTDAAMIQEELYALWKAEENIAHIHGWDFSHIDGRYTEQDDLPWDYRAVVEEFLTPDMKIMDIDTGGGEFLLSLNHPHENTAAMENYPPNVALCQEVLLPLGIDFRPGDGKENCPSMMAVSTW